MASWSGGKDSALAMARALELGYEVVGLLAMFSPETGTSRSHGLPLGVLQEQARSLGLPLHVAHASWTAYEETFIRRLGELAASEGLDSAVFGDIFLDDHRAWVEKVCGKVGIEAVEPLWGEETGLLAREVIDRGIEALVCTVRSEHLDAGWLGAPFDRRFLAHVESEGLDPCGEYGEFHTVVVAAPGRRGRLVVDDASAVRSEHYGHWIIDGWHCAPEHGR